jgi:drug/metabolite transporter (DMT)-like permease
MKTAVILTIAILANSIGNIFLTLGMRDFDSAATSPGAWFALAARHIVSDPWMIAGVVLLIVFLTSYMTALSWADLSFVLPATAPAYILTAFLAKMYLGESITTRRWAGTLLIVAGTVLVGRSFTKPPGGAPQSGLAPSSRAASRPVSATKESGSPAI